MIAQLERKRNKRDLSLQSAYFYARLAAEALSLVSLGLARLRKRNGRKAFEYFETVESGGGDSEADRLSLAWKILPQNLI